MEVGEGKSKMIAERVQQTFFPAQISLNNTARRKEISRINRENEQILKTLRQIKPTLPRQEWQKHIKYQNEMKRHLSKFNNTRNAKSQPRPTKTADI